MKIIGLSDTHGELPELNPCDIVCIAGDISPLHIQRDVPRMKEWIQKDFLDWVNSLDCKEVILIAGNHDSFLQLNLEFMQTLNEIQDKLIYLQDSDITINGIKFYGTPWCPELKNWAFYKNHEDLVEAFSKIPNDVDVLLTHCPPKIGKQGIVLQERTFNYMCDFGSQELADVVFEKKPRYVLGGHIHSGNHNWEEYDNIKLINVSLKDEFYNITYPCVEFTI